MNRIHTALLLVWLASLLAGCASNSGMIPSFQDITTETRRHGYLHGRQYEAISIPGLLPSPDAGFLYAHNPRRFPLAKVGVSHNATFTLVRTIGANCTMAQVSALRDGIMGMRSLADEVVELKYEKRQDELLKLQAVYDAVNRDEKLNLASAWSNGSKVGLNATELGALNLRLQNATRELAKQEKDLYSQINQPGLMIFRWNREDESATSVQATDMVGASYASSRAGKGFAVVGGVRVSTLFVGTDILDNAPHARDLGVIRNWLPMPTSLIQAKYITYVSEVDSARSFSLKVSVTAAELKALAADWEKNLNLELAYYRARIESLSNAAFMGNGTLEVRSVPMVNATFHKDMLGTYNGTDAWAGIYDVATPLNTLQMFMGKVDAPLEAGGL
ncbi:MAG: hypothetical protein H0S85_10600 [Desulfovibrionaceae bacterium]|jgi:hypothetical protein|nr:hypothetical protein [Desulfovibrionaceae bacterium]